MATEAPVQDRLEQLDKWKQTEGSYSVHFVGVGTAGAGIAQSLLESDATDQFVDDGGELTVWVVDIDEPELEDLRGAGQPGVEVKVTNIDTPTNEDLFETLRGYREYLKREYPAYYWQPNYDPWVPADIDLEADHVPRGATKAIYGHHYYATQSVKEDMREFAREIDEADDPPLVYLAFGLGGATGGGIVPDFARHLSHVMLGRRIPMTGIGVLPCEGDPDRYRGALPYLALNDIDVLIDNEANDGVVEVWGELYRNPFNNGFVMVSQEPAFQATGDLDATHEMLDETLADLITGDEGRAGWNVSRVASLLNNIDNPAESWPPRSLPTFDVQWVNLLAPLRVTNGATESVDTLATDLTDDAASLYTEVTISSPSDTDDLEDAVQDTFGDVAQQLSVTTSTDDDGETDILAYVPRLSKVELSMFERGQDDYESLPERDKVVEHSFLMELGVMLNEPSVRFEGVAGECIWGCACWVGLPMDRITGKNLEAAADLPETEGPPHEHAHEHEAHEDDD